MKTAAERWLLGFFCAVALILSLLAGIACFVDPGFQFRVRDNAYLLNERYVNAGLLKNYEYDTVLAGSCMVENFDMARFRQNLGVSPLKVGSPSVSPATSAAYLRLAAEAGRAERYYVCLDLYTFEERGEVMYPYLNQTDLSSRCRYLLGYETWFRFIPVDAGLALVKAVRGELPLSLARHTSIDAIGDWSGDFLFGEETALYDYLMTEPQAVETEGLGERMREQIDWYLSQIDFQSGEFTFFFPPYSCLYWCDALRDGYFDTYMDAEAYFIRALAERGCTVFSFQTLPQAEDLRFYMDRFHYNADVNVEMERCLAEGAYQVTPETFPAVREELRQMTEAFRSRYADYVR